MNINQVYFTNTNTQIAEIILRKTIQIEEKRNFLKSQGGWGTVGSHVTLCKYGCVFRER